MPLPHPNALKAASLHMFAFARNFYIYFFYHINANVTHNVKGKKRENKNEKYVKKNKIKLKI